MTKVQRKLDGNNKPYEITVPKVVILGEFNDIAIDHIFAQTGLRFGKRKFPCGMVAEPDDFAQIGFLLTTYDFKTRYYNNATFQNELHLKSDHHVGYNVDSVCKSCLDYNHIHNTLAEDERLMC